jgi:hypothetical protein
MRAIKFRGWDTYQQRMYHQPDLDIRDGVLRDDGGIQPMQYAECTDANGQEIYDGDLAVSSWTSDPTLYQASVSGRWGLKWKNLANGNSTAFMRPEESVRVIGNIWENPEILERKEDHATN